MSPLTRPGCAVHAAARRKRHQTYPELARARAASSLSASMAAGSAPRRLARHRAESVPAPSRPAAITTWVARWSGLLAVATQRALAASLLEPPAEGLGDGPVPDLHEVFADARSD